METNPVPLILTKLRPPASRSRTVQRIRLQQKLTLETETDLTLVCAPAGYGKTTLLVEWVQQLRQAGTAVAWYALDESDNRPTSFGAYLVAGLEQALGPGSGLELVSQMLRASSEVDLLKLLPAVINAICTADREIVQVLDDYHLIRTPEIHQAVEFLISHRPENLHFAIGSRSNPPLPLARLRARGRLVELRAPDLRFTREETQRFLHDTMQLDLPASLSSQLAEKVEGWPAGVQLAALSLPGQTNPETLIGTFTGGHRRLAEYLFEEVINQLPETLQSFLLYTSILERMCAPLCDAMLDIDNSAALLAQLEQLNLFIIVLEEDTAGAGTNWFRYHHLFRDFLYTWFNRTQPDRALTMHRAACDWFAANGSLREAAAHAFFCKDWPYAANFVEQHSFTLIIRSEISTIYEWCSVFPETFLRSRPRLCVFQGLALAFRFQGKYRIQVEERLQQANQARVALETPDQALEVDELASVVQTFLAMIPNPEADGHKQLELARSRLAVYPPGDPGRFSWLLIAGYAFLAINQPLEAKNALMEALPLALHSGLYFGMVEATFHLARLAYSCGQLDESLEICRKSQAEFEHTLQSAGLALPALGCLEIAAGCVFLERGQLEEAEQQLRQGLKRMGWGMNPYYLMTAYLALFRLHEIRGQLAEALVCLDQLDTLWPDILWLTQGYRTQIQIRFHPDKKEAVELAEAWLHRNRSFVGDTLPLAGMGPIGALEAYYQANLIWARLQIALGQPQVVHSYLQQQLQIAHEKGLLGREIELLLIEAQRLHKQSEDDQALKVLMEVIEISRPRGYLRVFDQSAVLDDLIHLAAKKGLCPTEIEDILVAIRAMKSRITGTTLPPSGERETIEFGQGDEVVEPLSERELEVLHMIAFGASNRAIAERFVITVGTVKSHIHHIFRKLDVRSRTEAVARARMLGLLTS